jgi:hypothetical protein
MGWVLDLQIRGGKKCYRCSLSRRQMFGGSHKIVNFGGVGQCGTRSEMSEYFCSELGGVGFFRGHTTLQRFCVGAVQTKK